MTLTELNDIVAATKETVRKHATDEAFAAVFRELFAATTTIKRVQWAQYAPYFNDGDPCVFCVHEIRLDGPDGDDDEEVSDDTFISGKGVVGTPYGGGTGISDEDCETATRLIGFLGSMDKSIFEAAFGDGVQVTATSSGLDVDSYDHD